MQEAKMDPGIRKALEQKGYKFLGKGQDQDAYLAPDGTILKIFGTDFDSRNNRYSEGQQSFIDFANFCMKNQNNPFLPQFGGWERFEFKGKHYLQIRCERMFELETKESRYLELPLETIAHAIDRPTKVVFNYVVHLLKDQWGDADDFSKFIMYIGGEDQLLQLISTLKALDAIANRKSYGFDMHSGNFMLGSDGHIVINDPFFTGTFR